MPRRNLIIVRCGLNSLHWQWLEGGERNWDLILCPYQELDPKGFISLPRPGVYKFTAIHQLLEQLEHWRDYQFICFPDDDISADAGIWNRFFDLCHQVGAHLASPALTHDSFYSHLITLKNTSFSARETTFAEIMMPCMSRTFLEKARDTMKLSRSGTGMGLDFLWPAMLSYRDIWIMDDTPVCHTRPVGSLRSGALHDVAVYDFNFIRHLGVGFYLNTISGILPDGRSIAYDDTSFSDLIRSGYSDIAEKYTDRREEIQRLTGNPRPPPQTQVVERLRKTISFLEEPDHTISRGKPCKTSSVSRWSWTRDPSLEATGANDGLINGVCGFHTDWEVNPWWQVDLLAQHNLQSIEIYNRLGLGVETRCVHLDILVSLDAKHWKVAFSKRDDVAFGGFDGNPLIIAFEETASARFIRIQAVGETCLHLDQVEAYGSSQGTESALPSSDELELEIAGNAVVVLERLLNHPRGIFLLKKLVGEVLDARGLA